MGVMERWSFQVPSIMLLGTTWMSSWRVPGDSTGKVDWDILPGTPQVH